MSVAVGKPLVRVGLTSRGDFWRLLTAIRDSSLGERDHENIFDQPSHRLLLGLILACLATPPTHAINITVQYDATQPNAVMPAFDPNGTQLMAIANYVANFYEDVFEDNGHSLSLTFWYTDLNGLLGDHDNVTDDANMGESVGNIKIDTQNASGVANNFFFDPTPANNSEFTMAQWLWRNVSGPNRADWYVGPANVPATFETGFTGNAPVGSPAVGTRDMLSLVFHEMGHSLGMSSGIPLTVTETMDQDYDFNSAFIFSGTLAADLWTGRRISLATSTTRTA